MCYRSVPTVPNALIVDSFEPHRSIQKCLSQKNCILHVIPNGCSSKFQPLNVGITHLFQVKLINLLYLFKKAPHYSLKLLIIFFILRHLLKINGINFPRLKINVWVIKGIDVRITKQYSNGYKMRLKKYKKTL